MFFNECVVQIGCELWDLTQVFCQNAQFIIMERVDVDGGVGFVGRDIFLLARIDRLSADDGITQRVAAALIVADHAARIGVVMQKAVLFQGTIAQNLRWGNPDATEEQLWHAIEVAQAADVVKGKEGGLDYVIEQGGRNLSGGQKQRLTIARAVVKDPEILILDDSASALDFATDARLRAALRNLKGNKTIFIVSQRTSSIQFADQILVMDDGQAVGLGTHEELLENCEIYREIYESQFKKEDLRKNGGAGNV